MTLIGESFGVERVFVPARQTCVALGCGCVQYVTDILCNVYEFERQTSLNPQTFFSRNLLNSIMQRQTTSIELEATSLNHYFQDVGVPDGVDDRGLGVAYWSYFHRKMAFQERHYSRTVLFQLPP